MKTATLDDVPAARPQQAASVRALGVIPSRELDRTALIVFASNLELLAENLAVIAWEYIYYVPGPLPACKTRRASGERRVTLELIYRII